MGPPLYNEGFFGWVSFGGKQHMTWLDTAAPRTMIPVRVLDDLELRLLPGNDQATLDVALVATHSGQDLHMGELTVVVSDDLFKPVLGLDVLSRIWFAIAANQDRPSEALWLFQRRPNGSAATPTSL